MIKPLTWIVGIVLLVLGLVGFVNDPAFGIFEVGTMQNIVHVVIGVIAVIAVMTGQSYARLFLIIFGLVCGVVAVIGFAMNGDILGIFDTNRADDYLYTAIALACLAVGFGKKK